MKLVKRVFRALLFLFILESVFAIHEYGHLTEFQKQGVHVKEFSLGIGPRIYQRQTADSLIVSLRLIPIMAYVSTDEEAGYLFEEHGSLMGRVAVDIAGVRNNFLIGLIIVISLQVLGWTRGNLSAQELVLAMVVTPFKILLRFLSFLVSCATFKQVDLTERFLLSTGGIEPPKPIKTFILLNLTIGLFNLAPVPPLDGGHIAQVILSSIGSGMRMPHIPNLLGVLLFATFYAVASSQDLRVLEIEKKDNPSEFKRVKTETRSKGTLGHWEKEGEEAPGFILRSSIDSSHFLSARTVRLLRDYGIHTIGDLREVTAGELLQIKNFGPEALAAVELLLSERGLSLKPEGESIKTL